MSACTFFGHKDSLNSIENNLCNEIEKLIVNDSVTTFYIGTQGNFDTLAYKSLKVMRKKYLDIKIYRVLAYMPKNNEILTDSILPEGIELINPRYAILGRNKWMIEHSEYVIYYVTHNFGSAAKFVEIARRKNKKLIRVL